MSRTYQTTIPTRSEMHDIIRAAFDRGVTFTPPKPTVLTRSSDREVVGFRNKVVIAKVRWEH